MIFRLIDARAVWRSTLCRFCSRVVGFAALTVMAAPAGAAGSTVIYFKDGTRTLCTNEVLEQAGDILCEYDGGLLIYRASDVARIEKGRSLEPERHSPEPPGGEPQQPPPTPAPASGTVSSAAPPGPRGVPFYDPRRPKKYWSSATRHHDTLREAIAAFAEEFNRPLTWVEENLGDSNDLSDVRATLADRLSVPADAAGGPAETADPALEFYHPRRPHKYMTGPETGHDSFRAAIEALARDFDRPAEWIERHMGESNDVHDIRRSLKSARDDEASK